MVSEYLAAVFVSCLACLLTWHYWRQRLETPKADECGSSPSEGEKEADADVKLHNAVASNDLAQLRDAITDVGLHASPSALRLARQS